MRKLAFASMIGCIKIFVLSFMLIALTPIAVNGQGAPPVRIGVVPGGGSGIEQEVVDRISGQLQENPNVVVSTVNPDWYVVCNIQERTDQMSGAIRYNGNITVKTTDGQVISNVAVQKYNQDFSLTPGATLNKALVDGAARDVISGLTERAIGPIQQAVETEMTSRGHAIQAMQLADQDKFDEAIAQLRTITPDSIHFRQCQGMLFALSSISGARAKAKKGQYAEALRLLKGIDKHSNFYDKAQRDIATYRAKMGGTPVLAKNKVQPHPPHPPAKAGATSTSSLTPGAQYQNLEQAKKALQMQEQVIDVRESALQMQQSADSKKPK